MNFQFKICVIHTWCFLVQFCGVAYLYRIPRILLFTQVNNNQFASYNLVEKFKYLMLTFLKGQMTGTNQLSVFTGSGLCQHMHMAK